MREIRTSGSMSGDGKRDDVRVATAPNPDSTENKGRLWKTRDEAGMYLKTDDANQSSSLFREVRKQQKSPLFRLDRKSASSEEEFLFLTERCGNIIENKGALLKTRGEAGMYKKTKEMRA